MKKKIIFMLLTCVVLFVVLSFLDRSGNYSAERDIWIANKRLAELMRDPDAVPDASFEAVGDLYRKFMKKYPNSQLTPTAHLMLGKVYVPPKKYDKAREVFENVIKKYPDNNLITLQALAEIGKTYSLQDDIVNAIEIYKRIMKDYPLSYLGLRAPFLIGKYYNDQNNKAKADEAFKNALGYYDKIISQYPGSAAEFDALRMKASCYLALGKIEEAVDIYEDILLRSADTSYLSMPLAITLFRMINSMSIAELKDYKRPVRFYKKFLEKYPKHPLNEVVEKIISGIETLEKDNSQSPAEQVQ